MTKQTLDDMLLEFRGHLFKCHHLMHEITKKFEKYEDFNRRLKENDENNGVE